MFMSLSRMKDLSAVVRSKLIIRAVDGREPTLVRISRRVSFAAMIFERVDSFVVFGQSVEHVLAGYALDPTAAFCCGNEELYLTGD